MTCALFEVVADWPLHLLTTEYLSLLAQTYHTTLLNIFKRRFLNVLPFSSLPKHLVKFRSGSSLRVSNLKFKTALIEERRFNNKTLVTSQCNKTKHSGLLLLNRWLALLSPPQRPLWVRSIGKSGFRFSKSKSRFPNRTRNPKTDFSSEKSVLRVDFN